MHIHIYTYISMYILYIQNYVFTDRERERERRRERQTPETTGDNRRQPETTGDNRRQPETTGDNQDNWRQLETETAQRDPHKYTHTQRGVLCSRCTPGLVAARSTIATCFDGVARQLQHHVEFLRRCVQLSKPQCLLPRCSAWDAKPGSTPWLLKQKVLQGFSEAERLSRWHH